MSHGPFFKGSWRLQAPIRQPITLLRGFRIWRRTFEAEELPVFCFGSGVRRVPLLSSSLWLETSPGILDPLFQDEDRSGNERTERRFLFFCQIHMPKNALGPAPILSDAEKRAVHRPSSTVFSRAARARARRNRFSTKGSTHAHFPAIECMRHTLCTLGMMNMNIHVCLIV